MGRWKHQRPLDSDTESKPEEPPRLLFDSQPPEPRKAKSEGDWLQSAHARLERRKEKVLDLEASRPLHQFMYQVDNERSWIQGHIAGGNYRAIRDIDEIAY